MAGPLALIESLPWALSAALMAVVVVLVVFRRKGGGETAIHASIESMRSVGELVAFKIIAKEIATHSEHLFQDFGKKWMRWLISEKKMAMIFEFEIDFRYDLRSGDFVIDADEEAGRCRLKMPACFYNVQLRNIRFYDEQESRLLPEVLPTLIARVFGGGFSEEDRNRLFEASRRAAEDLAGEYVARLRPEVEQSARETLENMARGLGMKEVSVDFQDRKPVGQRAVLALEGVGESAPGGAEPEPI